MPFLRVNVTKWVQDSQEYGSTDEHMVSRVFYSIDVDGVPKGDYYSDIKQVVGWLIALPTWKSAVPMDTVALTITIFSPMKLLDTFVNW